MNRSTLEIAPPGTFVDDFDWRYNLKKDDLIDCLDSEATWYRSTVLQTREVPQRGEGHAEGNEPSIKEVFVAYRYYSEEEGHKSDEEGKYVGWSNKYDAWIPVSSPQI